MRKDTSRFTQLVFSIAILGLLSSGCKTTSWTDVSSWPGASWFTGAKTASSEYEVPDQPSVGYASLPVDQAANYNDQGQAEPAAALPIDNPAATVNTGYPLPQATQPNYPTTTQGSAQYLTPPNTTERYVPPGQYQNNTINQTPPGSYDSSNLTPAPAATPTVGIGNSYQPIQSQPASTTTTVAPIDGSGYQQGFFKPTQGGEFATQNPPIPSLPANSNLTPAGPIQPIQNGSIYNNGTAAGQPAAAIPTPITPAPIYTGQLPTDSNTRFDGTTAPPLALPPVPNPGTYRPFSTNAGQ